MDTEEQYDSFSAYILLFARYASITIGSQYWGQRAIIAAAQYWFAPGRGQIGQKRCAWLAVLAVRRAIRDGTEMPEWFLRAGRHLMSKQTDSDAVIAA